MLEARGRLVAIYVAPAASAGMKPRDSADLVAGVGIVGDRYASGVGFYSGRQTDPGAREVTLIEAETLDSLERDYGITLAPGEHRRNLTTRGITLLDLLGQRFRVGPVLLEGIKDCPPCQHLQHLTGQRLLRPLATRGGLRARILEGGTITPGDEIAVLAIPSRTTASA